MSEANPTLDPIGYRCDGCGRLFQDPYADLSAIRAAGGMSCCPERKPVGLSDRIEELEVKLDKAVETLEFYGDERNYESEYIPDECGCCGSWYEPKIHKDGQDSGDKARSTLAELTGGKGDNP